MATTTQDNRILRLHTELGKDYLLINSLEGVEAISQLFSYRLEVLREEPEYSLTPTNIDVTKLVGKRIVVEIDQPDGTVRHFNGMVRSFAQGMRGARFSYYTIEAVPAQWMLTQKQQSRIFQKMSVPDILKKVLEGFECRFELQGQFHPRNYCVQYRETDFDFMSRLMEEEGIYYFFSHNEREHTMVIANTPTSHPDCPTKKDIPFFTTTDEESFVASINNFERHSKLQSGKVTLWDHSFQIPNSHLEAEKTSVAGLGQNQKLEIYDYPGSYAKRFDGVNSGGGEQPAELQKTFEDNKRAAEIAMQSLDKDQTVFVGTGDCSSIVAGHKFTISNHPHSELNGDYVVTSANHSMAQSPSYISDEDVAGAYSNEFTAIQLSRPFRPRATTPKPVVLGCQTAFVVGPVGEEIYTDKYGRVKVQFHWDREGKTDAKSSCWLRVSQMWAGNQWGTMFIPRIGMEVIVDFLEGDPDQPIITGCVYNAQAMPPYKLPDEKTKSTIKTDSSKGGGGFNEIRFEDKKGSEQIFIHGQMDKDVRIRNDSREAIGRDSHLIVKRDQLEKVERDKHLSVKGNQNEKVGGTLSVQAGGDMFMKTSMNFAAESGLGMHLKGGVNVVVEAGFSLTLKVGGNFVNINPGGVFIQGTMVMINSGGAAGAGAGCNPTSPTDPKEADSAGPGKSIRPDPPPPPPPRDGLSPLAQVMVSASQNATPFCSICGQ